MTTFQARIGEIVQKDPRFAMEAYEFVFAALGHTQRMLKRVPPEDSEDPPGVEYHVSGRELVLGIRDLALDEFGLMAPVVFQLWGIGNTGDFGEIVFNLIHAKLMSKTEKDNLEDFRDVFNLETGFTNDFRIQIAEPEWTP